MRLSALFLFILCQSYCLAQKNRTELPNSEAAFIESLYRDSSEYKVLRLNFNSSEADFGAIRYQDGLVFSSSRGNESGLLFVETTDKRNFTDLYYVKRLDSVNFGKPTLLSDQINTSANDGPACFNITGDVIYFTSNDTIKLKKSKRKKDVFLIIYEATKRDDKWENVRPINLN